MSSLGVMCSNEVLVQQIGKDLTEVYWEWIKVMLRGIGVENRVVRITDEVTLVGCMGLRLRGIFKELEGNGEGCPEGHWE